MSSRVRVQGCGCERRVIHECAWERTPTGTPLFFASSTPSAPPKNETIPSFFTITFEAVLEALQAAPHVYSVLWYDGSSHFDPILYKGAKKSEKAEKAEKVEKAEKPTTQPEPLPGLVPLPGTFKAVYEPSGKTKVGKKKYTVQMAWNPELLYDGCRLSFYVPLLDKRVYATVQKPAAGNLQLTLEVPDGVTEDSIALTGVGVMPKPVMAEPLQQPALPVVAAMPMPKPTTKRTSIDAPLAKSKKSKQAKPIEPHLPEPDFALEGWTALPAPTEVTIEALQDQHVAHRFSVADWAPGWCVGVVRTQVTGKRWRMLFEVEYEGFNPPVYMHALRADEYGQNWLLVQK